jgi:hypothetical protein
MIGERGLGLTFTLPVDVTQLNKEKHRNMWEQKMKSEGREKKICLDGNFSLNNGLTTHHDIFIDVEVTNVGTN